MFCGNEISGHVQNKFNITSPPQMQDHHHQSVLPKGRSFSAISGTKAAIQPKDRSSATHSEPWLQFY